MESRSTSWMRRSVAAVGLVATIAVAKGVAPVHASPMPPVVNVPQALMQIRTFVHRLLP